MIKINFEKKLCSNCYKLLEEQIDSFMIINAIGITFKIYCDKCDHVYECTLNNKKKSKKKESQLGLLRKEFSNKKEEKTEDIKISANDVVVV